MVATDCVQPPSGGCVLKQALKELFTETQDAAAFGRLCVETLKADPIYHEVLAAAFGRLCVETPITISSKKTLSAAAFGRLCVETNSRSYS